MTILVIEDDRCVRETLAEMLAAIGHNVLCAEDGYEGIRLFEQQMKVDAVILDMRLPKLSGEETYQKLKAIDPSVKVILTTGFISETERLQLTSLGLCDIIIKPYKLSDLRRVLSEIENAA
ncbi:MAG: response regulator [Chloroherpetonaceae bacterium]|nr:response regulator [Chloroherpetonaceae bacterium]MDW8019244.1 response regulator [Chloroherpetonaceae bacterium]